MTHFKTINVLLRYLHNCYNYTSFRWPEPAELEARHSSNFLQDADSFPSSCSTPTSLVSVSTGFWLLALDGSRTMTPEGRRRQTDHTRLPKSNTYTLRSVADLVLSSKLYIYDRLWASALSEANFSFSIEKISAGMNIARPDLARRGLKRFSNAFADCYKNVSFLSAFVDTKHVPRIWSREGKRSTAAQSIIGAKGLPVDLKGRKNPRGPPRPLCCRHYERPT